MKTLIVPTDFSPAAENALHYASQLARQIGAGIFVAHIYQIPVSMNDMPVILISADELKKNADERLERCAQDLAKDYPGLQVRTGSRLGDVNNELEDICKEIQPMAIIMGSHGSSEIERLFFGSTTLSVIRDSHYPVIAVPSHFKRTTLHNIVLAVDLLESQKFPVEKILSFMEDLDADIHVVHVTNNLDDVTNNEKDALLNLLQPLNPSFDIISNENVRAGLIQYLGDVNADLLLLFPHQHNLMERLFFKLHTLDIVKHTTIPVMTIMY